MSFSRIQQWALIFSGYQYPIEHRPGKHLANADILSLLPFSISPTEVPVTGEAILLFEMLRSSPLLAADIKR